MTRSNIPCTPKTFRAVVDTKDAVEDAIRAAEGVVAVTAGDMEEAVGGETLAVVVVAEAAEMPFTAIATIATSLATALLIVARLKLTTKQKKRITQK